MPRHQPRRFGTRDAIPEGLLGQLIYPLRTKRVSARSIGAQRRCFGANTPFSSVTIIGH